MTNLFFPFLIACSDAKDPAPVLVSCEVLTDDLLALSDGFVMKYYVQVPLSYNVHVSHKVALFDLEWFFPPSPNSSGLLFLGDIF